MIAKIEKSTTGYIARYDRHLKHAAKDVWAYLTENEKLAKWFPELSVAELCEGASYQFDMQDGTYEELAIVDLKMHSVLEFKWIGDDTVRFELDEEATGSRLVLTETIAEITSHTPKDLAGWHVCLDVIEALLDGQVINNRKEEWQKWHSKYVEAIGEIKQSMR